MNDNELLQAIYSDMKSMKSDIQDLSSDMKSMKSDIQDLSSDMQGMKSDMQEMKQRMTSIEVTLENETNRNIKIIAEGHTDLSRKLDLAIREDSEKELLRVRVNILENDIRRIKERLEIA